MISRVLKMFDCCSWVFSVFFLITRLCRSWTGLTCWGVFGLYWMDSVFGGPARFGTVCVESETPRWERPPGSLGLERHQQIRESIHSVDLFNSRSLLVSTLWQTGYRALVCPANWWGCETASGRAWGCFPLPPLGPCPARSPPLPGDTHKNIHIHYSRAQKWSLLQRYFWYNRGHIHLFELFCCLFFNFAFDIWQNHSSNFRSALSPLFIFVCVLRFVCHVIGWSQEQTVSAVPTLSQWTELQ